MNTDKATPELFAALAKAQGEIENAAKNAANPHFRSKYADLAEVLNTVRPVFSKHGLAIIQSTEFDGSLVSVVTLLAHDKGGFITAKASCVPAKSDAQGVGSATTYLRRYSAAAVAGIAQEDDDGQSAAHNRKPAPLAQKITPLDGVWDGFSDEARAWLEGIAKQTAALFAEAGSQDAADHLSAQNLDTDEKAAVWSLLDSKVRSGIKKAMDAKKESE